MHRRRGPHPILRSRKKGVLRDDCGARGGAVTVPALQPLKAASCPDMGGRGGTKEWSWEDQEKVDTKGVDRRR